MSFGGASGKAKYEKISNWAIISEGDKI